MDDIDRVFARFKDDKPEPANRRETLSIPRRSGNGGSRTVEVVHVRSGTGAKDRPRRPDPQLRAASWDAGFQAKRPVTPPDLPAPGIETAITPPTHVMPAWKPAAPEEASPPAPASPPAAEAPGTAERRRRASPRKDMSASPRSRRVADPFDAGDDGANCLRCGYAIEAAREKRGLLTCSECG